MKGKVKNRHKYDNQDERQKVESIRRGFAEMEAGHYIPHEAMKAWLLSLGSDHELPPAKCVCGKAHDGDGDRIVRARLEPCRKSKARNERL